MDTQGIIAILTWLLVGVGGLFLSAIIWFARRSVESSDRTQRLVSKMMVRIVILERSAGIRHTDPELEDSESP